MSGLRFKVGGMAIVAVSVTGRYEACVCTVIEIRHRPAGDACTDGTTLLVATDYEVEIGGIRKAVADWQLRKIDPPAEPTSLTRTEYCEVTA